MSSKPTWSTGQGENLFTILPPTVINCQEWETDIPTEQWSTGIGVNLLRIDAPVSTDCSGWESPAGEKRTAASFPLPRNRWLVFSGIAAAIIAVATLAYVTSIRSIDDPTRHLLFKNLAPSDREMLESADESTVVGITLSCTSPEIRQLGERYRSDPKTLLKLVRKELEK